MTRLQPHPATHSWWWPLGVLFLMMSLTTFETPTLANTWAASRITGADIEHLLYVDSIIQAVYSASLTSPDSTRAPSCANSRGLITSISFLLRIFGSGFSSGT